jgi:hypothetical protein
MTGSEVPVGVPAEASAEAPAEAPAAVASSLAGLVRAAVREELDEILPHVVVAIKRDRAFDELSDRLSKAERRLEARRERPLAVAVHRHLNRLRHLDFDPAVKDSLEAELVKILRAADFDEIGRVGEEYDPARHDALGGRVIDGKGTVAEVHASGLSSVGDVIIRAQVRVSPRTGVTSQADAGSRRESSAESAK